MERIYKGIKILASLVVISIILIMVSLFYIPQLSKKEIEYSTISFRYEEQEANRGTIFSMDEEPLSISLPYFKVRIDCKAPHDTLFDKELPGLAQSLSTLFKDRDAQEYIKIIEKGRKENKRYLPLGNRLVNYSEMLEVKRFPLFKYGTNRGGLVLEGKEIRNKPYRRLAFRTIGYINENGEGVGLEAGFNRLLEGKKGIQRVQKLLGGESKPVFSIKNRAPQEGYNLHTTINVDIQEIAERAIKEQLAKNELIEGGTAVVMEVKSGAIRAIVNLKKGKGGEYDESYNYALWHSSEPGSIFKLATLTALLEGEYINMESKIDAGNGKWQYGRYTISDVGRPLGLINVREAFANSSNVSFAKLAVENFGNREREFVERLSSLKIVEPLDLDIGRTAGTTIYAPGDAMWSKSSLPSMAIGYSVAITPINALTFYNAIANEGKIVYPYFIEKVEREGELLYLQNVEKAPALSICTKKSAATLKDALKSVVEIGTAKSIKDPRYTIGGKTGTARVTIDGKYSDPQGNRKYQASFVGFFPVEEPRYSVIVVIYSGKTKGNFYGGSWSAPVFKSIANNIYAMGSDWHLPIARTNGGEFPPLYPGNNSEIDRLYSLFGKEERQLAHLPEWSQFSEIGEETPLEYSPEALPNLYGMGLKDALFLAESLGYKVQFQGGGRVVSQIPLPGLQLAKGESLFLKLSTKDEIERVDRED